METGIFSRGNVFVKQAKKSSSWTQKTPKLLVPGGFDAGTDGEGREIVHEKFDLITEDQVE